MFQIRGLISACEAAPFISSEILPKSGLTLDTLVLTAALSFKISPPRLQEISSQGLSRHLLHSSAAMFDLFEWKSRRSRTLNKPRLTSFWLKLMQMQGWGGGG